MTLRLSRSSLARKWPVILVEYCPVDRSFNSLFRRFKPCVMCCNVMSLSFYVARLTDMIFDFNNQLRLMTLVNINIAAVQLYCLGSSF